MNVCFALPTLCFKDSGEEWANLKSSSKVPAIRLAFAHEAEESGDTVYP